MFKGEFTCSVFSSGISTLRRRGIKVTRRILGTRPGYVFFGGLGMRRARVVMRVNVEDANVCRAVPNAEMASCIRMLGVESTSISRETSSVVVVGLYVYFYMSSVMAVKGD